MRIRLVLLALGIFALVALAEGVLSRPAPVDAGFAPSQASAASNYVAAGAAHSCILTAVGRARCWGSNTNGQLGNGTTGGFESTRVIVSGSDLSGAVSITAGASHTCALLGGGTVKCWGRNSYGQLGDGTTTERNEPVDVCAVGGCGGGLLTNVVAIDGGFYHTCAVLGDGSARCWGYNLRGQVGDGSTTNRHTPVAVSGITDAVAIGAGSNLDGHTCAVLLRGYPKCWGANNHGQLGDGTTTDRYTPVAVCQIGGCGSGFLSGVVGIGVGTSHTCAVHSPSIVRCWGYNTSGQLGDGTTTERHTPVDVSGFIGAVGISAGQSYTCAVRSDNTARCWGNNDLGQLGDGNRPADSTTPVAVVDPDNTSKEATDIAWIEAGTNHNCAVRTGAAVYCWGVNSGGTGQLGDGTSEDSDIPVDVQDVSHARAHAITAGKDHTCVRLSQAAGNCWGMNYFGQLGDGTNTNRSSPVAVSSLSLFQDIDGGDFHTCALVAGGSAKCWGRNAQGQLGNNTTTDSNAPVAVSLFGGDATAIAAGSEHSCALIIDGHIECWGDNEDGQLGDGTNTARLEPEDVSGLSAAAIAIAAGGHHSCALVVSGDVECWGLNDRGQLGDGSTTDSNTPVAVSGLGGDPIAIAAGNKHTCALLVGGTVECWGNNSFGQLGDGQNCGTSSCTSPTDVDSLTNAIAIDAGGADATRSHTCAVVSDGGVECWGGNDRGQLGDGSTTDRHTPVSVSGLGGDAIAVATGGTHTCVLLANGVIECWGHNDRGQLGNGTTTDSGSPVPAGVDTDGEGCPDWRENGSDEKLGGRRNAINPWDYFNPTGDGQNRIDDVLLVIEEYRNDDPPNTDYADRTYVGPNPWDLGPPDGTIRIIDVLNIIAQYRHDCS